jgi:transcriptional regulator with XRE-family HTH domain
VTTKSERLLEQWAHEYEQDPEFVAQGLASETIEQVIERLEELSINRSDLASALHVPRQQVSRWLNAPSNLTLLSLARLAIALRVKPRIIFDSESYFIRSFREPFDYEEFKTDQAAFKRVPIAPEPSSTSSANSARFQGEPQYAIA